MRYGISAGSIIIDKQDRILLVHHYEAGKYNFWVPPGGSLEANESIYDCARRELLEETGLQADLDFPLYIQEFWEPDYHFVKIFILGNITGGTLTTQNKESTESFLIEAKFFSKNELQELTVFPEILKDQFWKDRKENKLTTRYLGLERLKF